MTETTRDSMGREILVDLADAPAAAPLGVLGTGLLSTTLTTALGERYRLVTADRLGGCAALGVLGDDGDTSEYPAVQRYAAAHQMPWLPVRVDSPWVMVGPAVLPPAPGCPTCVEHRCSGNRPDTRARKLLRDQHGAELAGYRNPLLTPLVAATVAALIADELDHLARDPASARTRGALIRLSMLGGQISRHQVLPDPLCPDCGRLPQDTAEASAIRLQPRPKPAPCVFRSRELLPRYEELTRTYVDAEAGLLATLAVTSESGGPTAVALRSPSRGGSDHRHGFGRTRDFRTAALTALAEALERIGGECPRGRYTAVRAAYADVADRALDPRSLGLYPDEWYDRPGFPFVRFHPEYRTSWVWGYSFARGEPLLVPESYVYYGPRPASDPGFAYECSNGYAIGSCLEEAMLYGLLEVAERDAALMTWYARLPVTRLDLDSCHDRRIPLTAELIRRRHGYRVAAFATTLEQRVPTFWIMAVDADSAVQRPRLLCGAGSHLDPEHGLRKAVQEMVHGIADLVRRYVPTTAAEMLDSPDRVRQLKDHSLQYGHPNGWHRFDFLDTYRSAVPLAALGDRWGWPQHDDLSADLAELIGRYLATGLDVIAVDTTSAEHRAGGFASAKVIVPGALPMTYGHRYRRTHGLPRLFTVPRLLGYRDTDLCAEDLNPYPHPFL